MKTHEFADALVLLARMLKAGRNMELQDWPASADAPESGAATDEVRGSDSVRDLVGRVLAYLADHPDALRRVRTESTKKATKASPELLRALSILLGDNVGEEAG